MAAEANVAAEKARIARLESKLAALKSATAQPKVVYRTVVRYAPEPKPETARQKTLSGYRVVGYGGGMAMVRTPSGAVKSVEAGSSLGGSTVLSVKDGTVRTGMGIISH